MMLKTGEFHEQALAKATASLKIFNLLKYEGKLCVGRNLREIAAIQSWFQNHFVKHCTAESRVVFPFLERHVPKLTTSLRVLAMEHTQMKDALGEIGRCLQRIQRNRNGLKSSASVAKLSDLVLYFVYILKNHIRAEDEIVYKTVRHELKNDELAQLEKRMRVRSLR